MQNISIIELDALLDTRVGIFLQMGLDLNKLFLGGYRNRVIERFHIEDYETYQKLYKERTNAVLTTAVSTELIHKILEEAADRQSLLTVEGGHKLCIYINMYPYDLTKEQQGNIVAAIGTILQGTGYSIHVMDKSYTELTPEWLKENEIDNLYLYQYELWLNEQAQSLSVLTNPMDTVIHSPWLISTEMDEELSNKMDEWAKNKVHPADIITLSYSKWFKLALDKSRYYSSIMADDKYPDYISQDQ